MFKNKDWFGLKKDGLHIKYLIFFAYFNTFFKVWLNGWLKNISHGLSDELLLNPL